MKATTEGVVRFPSLLAMTIGSFPSSTETQEFVVPRSIPMIFPIIFVVFYLVSVIVLLSELQLRPPS